MLESEAWRDLNPAARAVYLEVALLYNGRNNGLLALSVRDAAERCRINKDTAGRAFDALRTTGFLDCVTPGGFSRKMRHASEWRLTVETCDRTGELPSKAFMRWRPQPPTKGNQRSPLRVVSVPSIGTDDVEKAA
ncbi:helix-turn-helix domain-containing protein [Brevundimonas albigilva]|uniref:helix-turn-helix domain-containing protein n=1 Tax=Brevundimonas albigilva TaxID=1312364 RepID=UPI00201B843D|nr:helix-turn-helix domain-containing protein [Brevundimonas albigilva]UQV19170.1 helix-turn-helix domain-containing protein [Brevundimonas albigilva]